jgi:hypothetical protein
VRGRNDPLFSQHRGVRDRASRARRAI